MGLSDDEIITNIRGGAKREFARLVERYKDRAMTLAVRMLKSREDAEEAIQDAFVRAYNGLPRFEGTARFSTWLYRIVYNVCLTRLGKQKEEFYLLDSHEEQGYELEDTLSPDPHSLLESKDLVSAIKQAIGKMSPRYSTILSLFYFQEMSYDEICDTTGLPLGTVKAHLFRARSLLRKQFFRQSRGEYVSVEGQRTAGYREREQA